MLVLLHNSPFAFVVTGFPSYLAAVCQFFAAPHNTLSMFYSQLHSDREAIPDVPAIYFVMPTEDNVKRIAKV